MGREVSCEARLGRAAGLVRAHLDSNALDFRGALRGTFGFAELKQVRCEADSLIAETKQGTLRLMMGAREAALWLKKIQNPPSLADKLGLKAGVLYASMGRRDAEMAAELSASASTKSTPAKAKLVFVCMLEHADLAQFDKASSSLSDGAALWVVRAKGKDAALSEADLMAAAKRAGWAPTKTARWSDMRAAERFSRRSAR
jgi:hypothetical protein